MNIKKTLLTATAALIITPAVSFAADSAITVDVRAIVPNADGMSITAEGGWDSTAQTLRWDEDNEVFAAFRNNIRAKSSAAIEAYLDVTPQLRSGTDTVNISVKLDGAELGVGAASRKEVANVAQATAGKLIETEINAVEPTGGFVPGTYQGNVTMMFESAVADSSPAF